MHLPIEVSVCGQRFGLGRGYARRTLTIAVSETTSAVELHDGDVRAIRRTTTQPVLNIKSRPATDGHLSFLAGVSSIRWHTSVKDQVRPGTRAGREDRRCPYLGRRALLRGRASRGQSGHGSDRIVREPGSVPLLSAPRVRPHGLRGCVLLKRGCGVDEVVVHAERA